MNEENATKVVNVKVSIVVNSEDIHGFIEAERLDFKLNMSINRFGSTPFISCGEESSWMRMAMHSGSVVLMISYSLWSFLKCVSHDGAYGTEGIGYKIISIQGSPMVILKKIAIDIEELIGFEWVADSCFFSHEPQNFSVPYGTRVNVGAYALSPYENVVDEYGFQSGEVFTKWRLQINKSFVGVHCLEKERTVFAMIPSVVVQMSCPGGAMRHLRPDREENEKKWANVLVNQLREIGLHARDIHSEHHGIVILNKTPSEFVQTLRQSTEAKSIISKFKMVHWFASYEHTFCPRDVDVCREEVVPLVR